MIHQLGRQMQWPSNMTLITQYVEITERAKIKLTVKPLDAVPYNERQWGHWLAKKSNKHKTKSRTWLKLETPSCISWQQQLADELHKPIKRNFTRRRVITTGIDKIWCSDPVEMQQFSKWNKGYRYLLMVLDLKMKK